MRISWIILTFNRGEIVKRAIRHCVDNAGYDAHEIIWIDNGSTDKSHFDFMSDIADVAVLNAYNTGVARGYNAGMALATGDYVVITGCDMRMPDKWLATFAQYVDTVPSTGVACIYSRPLESCLERIRGPLQYVNELPIVPAMPIERRIFKRSLLKHFGYFPETFGLYGYDDLAWAATTEKACAELKLRTYAIPGMVAEHLGTEGIAAFKDGGDSADYHAFKQAEVRDTAKRLEFVRRRELGWPKFDWPNYD